MRAHNTHLLQVQLTEAEKRDIKTLAASQGLTLKQATLRAFEAWASQLRSRAPAAIPARGTTGADLQKPGQAKRAATPSSDSRRGAERSVSQVRTGDAETRSSHETRSGAGAESASMGSPPQAPDASSRAWLRRAAQLDWSKCPAVQRVPGKTGDVWVVRGTDAPLAEVLQSVAEGQPFLEIAEVFELTLQQLIAVVQFATQGGAPASAGR